MRKRREINRRRWANAASTPSALGLRDADAKNLARLMGRYKASLREQVDRRLAALTLHGPNLLTLPSAPCVMDLAGRASARYLTRASNALEPGASPHDTFQLLIVTFDRLSTAP